MPSTSHKNLTGTQVHEPKGVSSAAINLVYVSNGAGSGTWQKLSASQLTGTGNAFGGQLLHARVIATSGTAGGTPVSGAWTKRTLNTTTLTNEITSASISSGVLSLPAGTYFAEGWLTLYAVDRGQCRLRDTTSGTTLLNGATTYSGTQALITRLEGRFVLSGTKNIELQYWAQSAAVDGLGVPASTGEVETYATLLVYKVG